MGGSIFVDQGDGKLKPLKQQEYKAEVVLQELLADYPDLLAGEQMNPEDPRRWLLISREFPVPDSDSGLDRWWLDHLFVDQEGVPTLVEVKRSSNAEVRREVVAQMLEYAANAAAWSTDRIAQVYTERCAEDGVDPQQELDYIAGDSTAEEFWLRVKANLESGRLRLVFVADAIPLQLLRIVEFLNTQMDSTQVLAVEVPQYVGDDGLRAYVPRLLGQTARVQQRRAIAGAASRSVSRIALDDQSVSGCLEQLEHNPNIAGSREALAEFVREFAGMAMDLRNDGRAEVSYRPNRAGGDKAAIRLEVKLKGSASVRVLSCECAPRGQDGVTLFWSLRDLLDRSKDDLATTEHIRKLSDCVIGAISTEELRQDIKNKVHGTDTGKERIPLNLLESDKRPEVIQGIRVFCQAVGGIH